MRGLARLFATWALVCAGACSGARSVWNHEWCDVGPEPRVRAQVVRAGVELSEDSAGELHVGFEALLDARADAPMAGRSREDIVARAMDRAAEAAALHLDPAVADAIAKLLDISGPAEESLARIRALLKTAGINLDPQLAAMDARLATLKTLGVDPARVQFTAHFGRNMEYYTGFVFEMWARDKEGPVQIAGGGRYDSMMELLGAKQRVSAIGCAIRTERVLAAKIFAGGA